MKRYALALDLKDDEKLIAQYEAYHQAIWPEITQSILSTGVQSMEIYRLGNRLFMIMETEDDFSFSYKTMADIGNPKVQEWEELMWKYQQALPMAKPGEKWLLMDKIFALKA
ncbi:L-rhamnose mutarotase [Pedobacter sp. ASV28]|jgi:L-rhamnose mutarotase|uniref:L-rhamnose mutarotase n=1 Tax=Pedobacter sp. ASV28 TaxID=2795123 RepID=UPI0018EB9A6F|nr:L-rhamnose mutarotase [Pedobacter sp. ASV28]